MTTSERLSNQTLEDADATGGGADDVAACSGKVPAVIFSFWIIKVAATTLGGTGADTVRCRRPSAISWEH